MADWTNFDIERALIVQRAITVYNAGQGTQEDEVVPGYKKVVTRQANAKVNVRSGPGLKYAPISFAVTGDWAKPTGPTVKADNYTWQPITLDKDATSHVHGYVALEVVQL